MIKRKKRMKTFCFQGINLINLRELKLKKDWDHIIDKLEGLLKEREKKGLRKLNTYITTPVRLLNKSVISIIILEWKINRKNKINIQKKWRYR